MSPPRDSDVISELAGEITDADLAFGSDFDNEPTPPMPLEPGDRVLLETRIGSVERVLRVTRAGMVTRSEFVGIVDAQRNTEAAFLTTRMRPLEIRVSRTSVVAWVACVLAFIALELAVALLVFRR